MVIKCGKMRPRMKSRVQIHGGTLHWQSTIAVIAAESVVNISLFQKACERGIFKGIRTRCFKRYANEALGSIQSRLDRFASFVCQTTDNCNNSCCSSFYISFRGYSNKELVYFFIAYNPVNI